MPIILESQLAILQVPLYPRILRFPPHFQGFSILTLPNYFSYQLRVVESYFEFIVSHFVYNSISSDTALLISFAKFVLRLDQIMNFINDT